MNPEKCAAIIKQRLDHWSAQLLKRNATPMLLIGGTNIKDQPTTPVICVLNDVPLLTYRALAEGLIAEIDKKLASNVEDVK